MTKSKKLREINLKDKLIDQAGWEIPQGTTIYVTRECPPRPWENKRVLLIRVDNGTGILNLMPETTIVENLDTGALE